MPPERPKQAEPASLAYWIGQALEEDVLAISNGKPLAPDSAIRKEIMAAFATNLRDRVQAALAKIADLRLSIVPGARGDKTDAELAQWCLESRRLELAMRDTQALPAACPYL